MPLQSAMGEWELVADVKLKEPLCDIGCLPISRNEVLLFGGLNVGAKEVKDGRIFMHLDGAHMLGEEKIDLLIPD